jgi:hypothetical protein
MNLIYLILIVYSIKKIKKYRQRKLKSKKEQSAAVNFLNNFEESLAPCKKYFLDNNGYFRFFGSNYLLHRWAAQKKLGRKLHCWEVVHHIDGNKTNNHPDNLMVCSREAHYQIHVDNLNRYGDWHGRI